MCMLLDVIIQYMFLDVYTCTYILKAIILYWIWDKYNPPYMWCSITVNSFFASCDKQRVYLYVHAVCGHRNLNLVLICLMLSSFMSMLQHLFNLHNIEQRFCLWPKYHNRASPTYVCGVALRLEVTMHQ